jgi:tetratricopeptide (TPR) repeat protein
MKLASHCGASIFRDVHFVSGAGERRTRHSWRLLLKDENAALNADPQNWFTSVSPVLEKFGDDAMYQASETFCPPTPVELFYLTRSSHLPLPQEWDRLTRVSEMFDSGDVSECIALFTQLLLFEDDAPLRNNRGFCQLVLAQKDAALLDFQASLAIEETALTRMNESLVLWLNGDQAQAAASLQRAWELAKASGTAFAEEERLLYAAIAREDGTGVDAYPQMLLGDAICENFVRLGVHSQGDATALRDEYKAKATAESVERN